MARRRSLVVKGDSATMGVYCLKTASWEDYLAFMTDAESATKEGRVRDANRVLRAAVTCLFSHVEGVVNDVYAQRSMPGKHHSLCEKAQAVALAAARRASIPFAEFRLEKQLRDLVAHPGITKAFSDPASKKTRLDQGDVFDRLSTDTLRNLERRISPWLDAICGALGVDRFTDTKREIDRWMPILSGIGKSKITEV